jgi:hypothetical protein
MGKDSITAFVKFSADKLHKKPKSKQICIETTHRKERIYVWPL